jgi:nucleotide-binding universal stress UspA family protein
VSLAKQTLEHGAALLRRAGVEVSCEVVVAEEAAPAILERAAAPDIAFVAIATHGAGDAWHMPIGATSSRVVRDSSRPLLVLPNAKPSRGHVDALDFRRVVALVDQHDVAEHDLAPLWALAGTIDGTVVLAAVRPAHTQGADGELEAVLRDGAAQLRDHGASVRTRLIDGTVDELARRVCEEEQADLLALTLHGGRERHWFGDIAGRVLRRSCLPALLVPVNEIEHAAVVGGSATHQRAAPFIR